MKGFVTFGEIMLRLTPSQIGDKILIADEFSVGYAGSESNVATSLACLGNKVSFISKVPNNPLGNAALLGLNKYKVDTDMVLLGGNRIGTYFIELGASIRPSRVVYDREMSAISDIQIGEFDWETILKNKEWLHLSGITPALSQQCAEETILAAKTAKEMGVKVSFDLNFRRSLWPNGEKAKAIFNKIIEYSDLIFGNLGVLNDVYGLTFTGENLLEQTKNAIKTVSTLFGEKQLAFTIREHSSASENKLQGIVLSNGKISVSKPYNIQIKDRFGTGDAFAAAYLHGISKTWESNKCIEFATSAFALKHTLKGDLHTSTEDEILSIMNGNISGHVIR